ncbi:PREDICTED: proteasome-associated protein ECM29 homolog [Branchiostoma belcheri]|uniref:Proteasome-associated protein ECM29 homolog n=1 Tax=Branchiostoma belcheri TaxID=7741 RepID=A0A6P4Z751_BRABE|nr:PREDICTED: proteasome-associated protein ECM29 homolog [Branchiostoma belcheri]
MAALDELEQLERVFLRLGLAETDDQLQATVSKFLSPVLLKLSSTQEGVRKKVMELLVHLNKRLKSRPKIQLPVESLLLQYQDPSAVSFVTNFTIIYIKMGYPRLPMDKQVDLLPSLLQCLEDKPQPHQDSLLQLMMPVLNHLKMPEDPERRKAMFRLSEKPKTAQIMLEFMMDMLLLPYVVLPPGGAQAAEGGAEGGRPQSAPANTSGGTPPGMSQASVKRVTGDKQWKPEELEEVKVGIIKFLGADIFADEEIIPHLLVGMSDTRHGVATAADYEFRRKQSGIDWNNTALITRLYKLFLGYTAEKPTKKGAPTIRPELRREPAGTRVRLKVFPYYLRSREAAEHFPGNLQIIFECLYGVHTNAKLRQMTLQFIHYICSCASDAKIQPLGQLVLNALQKLIGEGKEDAKLRSLAYVAIGKLANRLPHLFSKDIGMVQKFFDAVSKEDQDTRLAIQEALSLMATAYRNLDDNSARLMEALILSNVEKPDAPARLAAVHYANTVFPSNHVPSRYVLLLACGDSKEEIHSEATKALKGSPQASSPGAQDEATPKTLPGFKEMVTYINEKATQRMKSQAKYSVGANAIPFNPGAFTETVLYMRRCLATDAGVALPADDDTPSPEGAPAIAKYVQTLLEESGNSNKGPVHLYMNLIKQLLTAVGGAGPLYCLLEIVAVCPNKLAKQFTGKLDWIKGLMHHSRDDIREHASQLYGLVACTLGTGKFNNTIKELTKNLHDQSPEVQHGSVLGLGYAIGRHLYVKRTQVTVEDLEEEKDHGVASGNISDMEVAAVKAIVDMLDNPSSLLASAACTALGEIARNGPLPLPTGGVGKGKGKNPNPCTKLAIVDKLVARVKSSKDSNKLKERLCQTLGYLPVGDPEFQHQRAVLQGLLEAAEVRAPELHFTVGEALACAALGPRSGAGRDMWTEEDKEYNCEAGGGRGKDEMAWMVGVVLEKYSQDPKPWIRQSAGIWLLSLVKKAGEHQVIQGRLKEIQNIFLNLLSEPDDLTQDVGSKGLGLVYERGGSAHRDELVALLVDTLMSGRRSAQHVTGETAVFQSGELGRTPGGESMSTYKELCSLASDLNQPDLIYKFMNLANHNAMWNSKKGAAFGFSTIALQAGEQLTPYLPKIIPRLYRYQFDPNPNIRQSMTSIWSALVPETRKTIDKYMKEILEDLQTNLTNSQWRVRESSCMALNDLLRGRQLEEAIIEALPALWETCLKVRDDIKESVRNAAEKACQGLMRTSIKVCDPSAGKLGEKAVELVLPCLMKTGLGSSVKEVRAISLMTILKISQNAGKLLKPHIAVLVPALLEALSGLEPQALNYLSFHVGGGASQAEKLDSARIAASKASPMMEVANLCVQYVDGGVLPDLVPRLTDLIRSGVGVATKAGCSNFIISLTVQCSHELQPHAGKLLSALLSGLNDRNTAVRKNYAAAIGHLVKSAKDSSVEKLIAKLKTWYLEKEESSIRQACGLTLQAMARHNPDVLKRHATQVLPLAFLAMHEKRDKAGGETEQGQSVWEEVWLDSIPGTESGIKLYLKEIIELVRPALEAQSWHTKAQAASAMNTVATKLGANLGPPHLGTMLKALVGGLAGRTWKGKEELLKAITSVCIQCKTSLANPQEGTTSQPSVEEVVEAVLKESRKEKLEYKKEAIRCLCATLETYNLDRFKQLSDILFPLLRKSTDGNGNKETDEDEIEKQSPGLMEDFLITSYEGLGKAWPQEKQTQAEYQEQFGSLLCTALTSSTWKVQCAVLKATACYIDRLWMLQDGVTLTNEDTTTLSKFVEQLIPPLCQCLENTKYTTIRLEASSVASKLLKTLSGPDKDSILPPDSHSCLQKSAEKLGKDSVPELQDRAAEIKRLLQPSS